VSKQLKYRLLIILLIAILSVSTYVVMIGSLTLSEYPIPSFDTVSQFVDSNRYTHQKSTDLAINQLEINPNYTQITTDLGDTYVDENTLAFQVINSNGYIFSSTIDYEAEAFPLSVTNPLRSALNIGSFKSDSPSYAITRENLLTPNTTINLTWIDNGFSALIKFGISRIEMRLNVTFESTGIKVEIPQESIDESGLYKLYFIQVYRDFGSVKEDFVPGYIFLPDGIGALVDYKKANTGVNSNYQKSIYGNSIGYNVEPNLNNIAPDGSRIYAPVFGFVHGVDQNAIFAEIESGAAYGNLNLYYPSRNRGYTTVFPEFVFRRTYSQPIDKIGNTITLMQQHLNDVDIKIKYQLLENENANYVGMAKAYRESLLDKGLINSQMSSSTDIPLHLETLMLEKKEGILFKDTIVMTTFKQFEMMIKTLNEQEIYHIIATIDGYTKHGASWSPPSYQGISRKVGSKSDLAKIEALVSDLYLMGEFMMASTESTGYNQYQDLAKKINDQLYRYTFSTDTKYLLEHNKIKDTYRKSIAELKSYAISGMALRSFGSLLYDDFSNQKYLNNQIELLNELLAESNQKNAIYDANDYLWGQMDAFFEFPMYSSQLIAFDDTVPFLSIVLSGHIDLFGPYANFYPYARDELLRLIDFNIYPTFIVTHKSSKYLQETGLESIYSSRFTDLSHAIGVYYHFVNDALSHTLHQQISNREILANGVVKVTYGNGVFIIVNYTNETVTYDETQINPKDYHVGGIL
jgi:hypothetical protein